MKQKIAILLLITLSITILLCGCHDKNTQLQENYDFRTDCQLVNSLSVWNNNIAKCETGYYVLIGEKIYYIEKETMQATFLCNKPNCLHNNDDCNAQIGTVDSICYSDGYIYYLSNAADEHQFNGAYLTRMSADGSQRKNILYMDIKPVDWIIHRGYFYYAIQKYTVDESTGLEDVNYADCYIYSYPTDESSRDAKEMYFAEEIRKDAQINSLIAYGDNIYFQLYGMQRNDKSIEVRKSLKMNIQNHSVTEMVSSTGYSLNQPMYLDGMLVFSSGESHNGKYVYYKTDFDGNNPEKFCETYEGESVVCDGKYLYIDNYYTLAMPSIFPQDDPVNKEERYIIVFDSKLNKIDEFSLGDGSAKTWYLFPVDDEKFIFGGRNDTGDVIFYYNKSEFGTLKGNLWEKRFSYHAEEKKEATFNDNKPGAISESVPVGSETLISLWQKAKEKEYGVKDTFQSEGANVEGGFSIKLCWEQNNGTVTSYFPILEFESEGKAKSFMSTYPYSIRLENYLVLVGVETVPKEIHSMLVSILNGSPIEPINSTEFSGEFFSFS